MNRLMLAGMLAVAGACLAVAAPTLAAQDATPATTALATTASKAKPEHAKQRAVPPIDSRMCLRSTGSLLPPPKGQCLPVAGQSYSQQDIQRTGADNVGQALQMLDPSVRVGH